MGTRPKIMVTLGMAIGATVFLQTQSATAISADLAKKCTDLAFKAYPYTAAAHEGRKCGRPARLLQGLRREGW